MVAARPSMGKTAFCLNIAANAASEGQGVAIFSLEMSKESLVQRMLTATARVDSHRVRQGTLRDSDFTQLARAAGILQTYQLWIDDTPVAHAAGDALQGAAAQDRQRPQAGHRGLPAAHAEPGVRREPGAGNLRHLALAQGAGARAARFRSSRCRSSRRASEQRGGERKPILSDLRDSGAIEQDADLVIFIHRPEYYDREDESKRGLAEVMLAKNRNGPTGDVQLRFVREYTRFDNLSGREEPE